MARQRKMSHSLRLGFHSVCSLSVVDIALSSAGMSIAASRDVGFSLKDFSSVMLTSCDVELIQDLAQRVGTTVLP
jgi:hypothetical protein